MEKVTFSPCRFGGTVTVPTSKSFTHRAVLCAALSKGRSVITGVSMNRDIEASLNFVSAVGARAQVNGSEIMIDGSEALPQKGRIDCIESGSTLRFIIPVLAALGIEAELTGGGRLPERPMDVYCECMPPHGGRLSAGTLPLTVSGRLESGVYKVRGNVSSQFITGLLLALPLLEGDSEIRVTGDFQSKSYVNITVSVLNAFGIEVTEEDNVYRIKGNQKYVAAEYATEGDWSQAAFFMTMGALSEEPVTVRGLRMDSVQGDRQVLELYRQMGANIEPLTDGFKISAGRLKGITADVGDIPDCVPALAVCCALSRGESRIVNAARLRFKECDRLRAVSDLIGALGGKVLETEDSLIITGVNKLGGGEINSRNDHRILMAAASAMGRCGNAVTATDPWCVNKSYPNFYQDYVNLGGSANVINVGR